MPGKINPKHIQKIIEINTIGVGVPEPGSDAAKRLAELKNKKTAKKTKTTKQPSEKVNKKRFGGALGPNGIL